jgi:hypothetical protein
LRGAARDLVLLAAIAVILATAILLLRPALVDAACHRVGRLHPDVLAGWNPSRWRGCSIFGSGDASVWPGPGVARNDCLYPWTACPPIRITSIDTGRSYVVAPTMFCDCYTRQHRGRYRERLVDLDPAALRALGLPMIPTLYPVTVAPVERMQPARQLPDTSAPPPGARHADPRP